MAHPEVEINSSSDLYSCEHLIFFNTENFYTRNIDNLDKTFCRFGYNALQHRIFIALNSTKSASVNDGSVVDETHFWGSNCLILISMLSLDTNVIFDGSAKTSTK